MSDSSDAVAGAVTALQSFIDANERGDADAMRACLSKGTLESGGFSGPQEGAVFSLGDPVAEGELVVIPLRMRPVGVTEEEAAAAGPGQELQAVMVREDGEWKFDLATSQERMMRAIEGALGGAMEQMTSAMGEAMEGIAGAMEEAFGGEDSEGDDELAELLALEDGTEAAVDATSDGSDDDDEVVTNDTLFTDAVVALEGAVPSWQMQIEMALGHPTPLVVDWSTLNGRYDLVQGMVHVGVVQSLGAISAVGFDPATRQALSDAVRSVRIEHVDGITPGSRIGLGNGELVLWLDVSEDVTGPPDGSLGEELRRAVEFGASEPVEAPGAALSPAMSAHDRGEAALAYMTRLEELMRAADIWPGDAPVGPIEVRGAFGCENMAFEQWLAWILIPRVRGIVAAGESFPSGSMVGTYAVRALDGAHADDVIGLLYDFDQFIGSGSA